MGKGFIDDLSIGLRSSQLINLQTKKSLIYFISRGADCSNHIKKMVARLKEHKKESEAFWKLVETWSDNKLRLLGLKREKRKKENLIKTLHILNI